MEHFRKLEGSTAVWYQPKAMERRYELRAEETLLGTLSFRSSTGTLALSESASGIWSYKRVGFLNTRITIRREGNEENIAVYKPNLRGHGVLTFKDGASFAWKSFNFWGTACMFVDASDQPVVRFNPGVEGERLRDVFKTQATVEIEKTLDSNEIRDILLSFGMYLLTMHEEDNGAILVAAIG